MTPTEGWTLVLKADGNNATFAWASTQWATPSGSITTAALDQSANEALYPNVYTAVPFTKIRMDSNGSIVMGMAAQTNLSTAINTAAPTVTNAPGSDANWLGVVSSSNLQENGIGPGGACVARAGINAGNDLTNWGRVRIGTTGANAPTACSATGPVSPSGPASVLGVGVQMRSNATGACTYTAGTTSTAGNIAPTNGGLCSGVAGGRNIKSFMKVWLQ